MLEKNPDTVKIVFKNFPLGNHKFAVKAATAALAAGEQNKFWEFHDELFKIYKTINDKKIKDIAISLDLDQVAFDKKLRDSGIYSKIRKDTKEGRLIGVRGTPTIYVNGRRLKDRSLNGFQRIIDGELKKLEEKSAS